MHKGSLQPRDVFQTVDSLASMSREASVAVVLRIEVQMRLCGDAERAFDRQLWSSDAL